jgi:hypothetical protein
MYSLLYIMLTLVALLPYAERLGIVRNASFYRLYNRSRWDYNSISGLCLVGMLFLYTIENVTGINSSISDNWNFYGKELFLSDSTKTAVATAQSVVESVGARLADSVNKTMPVPLDFKFKVNADYELRNASSDGYGNISMTLGLLDLLKKQKGYNYYDLVAAALSHELAHVVDRVRFDVEKVQPSLPLRVGVTSHATKLPLYYHGADLEYYADSIGANFMKQSGFNPNAMLGLLQILENEEGETLTEITHPLLCKRVKRFARQVSNEVVKMEKPASKVAKKRE